MFSAAGRRAQWAARQMTGQASRLRPQRRRQTNKPRGCGARSRHGDRAEPGFEPVDREFEKLGYDIESRSRYGKLRFIRGEGTRRHCNHHHRDKNEILYSLNKPHDFILAIVEFRQASPSDPLPTQPFQREPDFA